MGRVILMCGERVYMEKSKKTDKQQMRRRVMITLPNDLWKRLRIRAIEEGIPASHLLEKILEQFLEARETAKTSKPPKNLAENETPLF
mgnify:CR=1 FL=1